MDTDFAGTEPDIERKISQFIHKLLQNTIKHDPKQEPKQRQRAQSRKDKLKEAAMQQEQLKDLKPQIKDLDALLRLCFKEKEFVKDELMMTIESQVGKIHDYNQQYLEAVVRLQENLQVLEDPSATAGAPTFDADDYDGQFNAKRIMHDQMRGAREDAKNFLIAEEASTKYRKDEDDVNMRQILGNGKQKPWKPNKIEFGKALKALFNNNEHN